MAYLNVEEIEAALDALALSYPAVTELITLPTRPPVSHRGSRRGRAGRLGAARVQRPVRLRAVQALPGLVAAEQAVARQ